MRRTSVAFVVLLSISLAGCATGFGRAIHQAFVGADPEYVQGVQFMHETTGDILAQMFEAAEAGSVIDPATHEWSATLANRRFRLMEQYALELETWEKISGAVADYSGANLNGSPSESARKAMDRAKRLLAAIRSGVQQ